MRHLMDRVFAHYGMKAVLESGGSKKTVRVFFSQRQQPQLAEYGADVSAFG